MYVIFYDGRETVKNGKSRTRWKKGNQQMRPIRSSLEGEVKSGEIGTLETDEKEFWVTQSVEYSKKVHSGNEWRVSTGFCNQGVL